MGIKNSKEIFDFLSKYITENRLERFNEVIKNRTRRLTVVLEDIYQPHNASAVLRTCDCFGIQDVHIIENQNEYRVNPDVALGASKWLNIYKYNKSAFNTPETFRHLKKKGYRIVATVPHQNSKIIDELPVTEKTALVFGTEMHGLSDFALKSADEFIRIPMYGFTDSFNISVSAALVIYHLSDKLRKSESEWHLSNFEQQEILLDWAKNSVKRPELLIEKFLKEKKANKQ